MINKHMSISLLTKVHDAIRAIDAGQVDPIVTPGDGFTYLLDTSLQNLGNLRYTKFNADTGYPISGHQVRYSTRHTIVEALYNPLPRTTTDPYASAIPGRPLKEFDSSIIPGSY